MTEANNNNNAKWPSYFGQFWVEKPHHSDIIPDKKWYLYYIVARVRDGARTKQTEKREGKLTKKWRKGVLDTRQKDRTQGEEKQSKNTIKNGGPPLDSSSLPTFGSSHWATTNNALSVWETVVFSVRTTTHLTINIRTKNSGKNVLAAAFTTLNENG